MNQQPPKHRHHFTPVLYLKNFTDDNRLLHVVLRKSGRRIKTPPERIGFERDLYWPNELGEGENPNKYEDAFSLFESKAAPVIERVLLTHQMPADEQELAVLFNFIAFQACRTPSMRRAIAVPREHEARIIMNMLASSKSFYEIYMRRLGCDLGKHPNERLSEADYVPRLTTEGFIDGLMAMMDAMLRCLYRRSWLVVSSDRPGESFVVSDHPVVLAWSNGRGTRIGPGHAHTNTDLTIALGSRVALLGCFEEFKIDPRFIPVYVSGINSRTIDASHIFVGCCEERFILQDGGQIISSAQFIARLESDRAQQSRLEE